MKSIKKNFMGYGITLIVGLGLLAFLYLSDFEVGKASNILFGMSWGLIGAGLGGVLVSSASLKNPSKAEEIEINEKDERNIYIREKTNSKVYSLFIYVECLVIFITTLLGYTNITILLAVVMLLKLIAWFMLANNIAKNC